MVTLTLSTAGPPKRQIYELAFGDIGSAGYEFGRTPEEINDTALRLIAMMREYPFSTLGFNFPAYGVGRPEELSGIPDQWLSVVAAKLALRVCPMMGATMSTEAKANLASGMALLNASAATIPTMPYARSTPSGLGTKRFSSPYLQVPDIDDTDPSDPGDLAALLP